MSTGTILETTSYISSFFTYVDSSQTLSGIISGTISGLISVGLAAYIAKYWLLNPKFEIEIRKTDDGRHVLILVNSKRFDFEPDTINFFLITKKEAWERGLEFQIKEGSNPWAPVLFDTQTKNINKKPHIVLPMTIPQHLHPNSPTAFLILKTPEEDVEFYYAFRTKLGTFPRNFSVRATEKGRLPKIKVPHFS